MSPSLPEPPLAGPAPYEEGAALAELAGLLMATDTFADLLQGVAELSVWMVEKAATCGITLSHSGRVMTVASADALARELDEQQYERDDGPCLQALRTGRVVLTDDFTAEDRWGDYPEFVLGHGIWSVLSTPLVIDGDPSECSTCTEATSSPRDRCTDEFDVRDPVCESAPNLQETPG